MSAVTSSPEKANKNPAGVTDTDRYKFVVSQIQHLNDKIIESFKLFIQLSTAITAAYVWWRTQPNTPQLLWPRAVFPTLMFFVGLTAVLLIGINLRSWWGFRKAESALVGSKVPPPRFPRSASQEIVMVFVIMLTTVFGSLYFAQ